MGSSPSGGAHAPVAQLETERKFPKLKVVGSSPTWRPQNIVEGSYNYMNRGTPSNIKFLLERNKSIRAEKLKEYYKDPSICKFCKEVIRVNKKQTVSKARKKKFCNSKCAASYNNRKYPKREKHYKLIITQIGGITGRKTKRQLFGQSKYYTVGRNVIRKHAVRKYEQSNKPKKCYVCGYDKHIDVCHIKPVASFPDNAFIHDINAPSNLVALCPTHHWEFDNGYLKL